MKRALKKIRSIPFVNSILRNTVKGLNKIGLKIDTTHITVSGVVQIKLPDNKTIKMYSKGDDYIPTVTYWNGYDAYEIAIAPFYQLSKNSNSIIDIGANIGYFSLIAKAANPSANVYAFEPVPRIAKRLLLQNHLNKFNIHLNEAVVGDSNESVKFYIPKGDMMSLAASTKKGWVSDVDEVIVPSTTLDHFKQENNIEKIDLIKMDCEFHELEVLRGMESILKEDSPVIMSEILFPGHHGVGKDDTLNQYKEIEQLMNNNGYFFYQVKKDHLLRVDKLMPNEIDRNYIFSTKRSTKNQIPFSAINSEIQ